MHQCAAGLRDYETYRPIKKPTEFWASDYCLISKLATMQCRCTKRHATLEGTFRGVARTHMARVWPWQLASAVASGVSALIQRQYRQSRRASRPETSYHVVYPVNSGELPPYEMKRRSVPSDWECPGCRRSHPGDSLSHTRKQGQCKWVHVLPKYWECSACRQNKSSDHPDHIRIDGKCRQ